MNLCEHRRVIENDKLIRVGTLIKYHKKVKDVCVLATQADGLPKDPLIDKRVPISP